jgi:hypothetical protein
MDIFKGWDNIEEKLRPSFLTYLPLWRKESGLRDYYVSMCVFVSSFQSSHQLTDLYELRYGHYAIRTHHDT